MELLRTEFIDVDLIEPDPNQPRKNKPVEYLKGLGESIKTKGLRNAIHVRENPDYPGKYLIINGECRWTAGSLFGGLKEIECKVFAYSGENAETDVFVDQIMDNVTRKDMDPLETLQAIRKAIDSEVSIDDLSAAFGVSKDVIEKDLPILKLPEALLTQYDKGNIPKVVARKLAEQKSEKRMLTAWKQAKTGKNVEQMLSRITAYENQINQVSLFPKPVDIANDEKKKAKILSEKMIRVMNEYQSSPFANGKGNILMIVNSKKLAEIETTAKEMKKAANKIMADLELFRAQKRA